MSAKKDEVQKDVPDQGGVGVTPGDVAKGNLQRAQSGVHSNFAHASPDSLVNPPGAPQSGAGSIAGKAAGEVPGGVAGQLEASRRQQAGDGRDAAGGVPGTPAEDGRYGVHSSGGVNMERSDS